ncbi:MAG TPA: Slp family lipoprotein [Nitrospira sp.]|jgi:outer membrane lipoprotein|nr:Slp family lipoprotein [Nitrospira sp.]
MPRVPLLLLGLFIMSSCAQSAHQIQRETGPLGIPPELDQQIDTTVTFAALQAAPASYVGRVVAIGGIVIMAKRMKERTEMEILELPTRADGPSTKDRFQSRGRFLAVREEFLDPASVPPGTPVTIIGIVKGSTTRPLDESDYTYPILDIKHLVDWNTIASQDSGGGAPLYYGPYYPPFGYWGRPYGYYPYWGRPYPFVAPPRPSAPPPPPPQGIPPRFRRR